MMTYTCAVTSNNSTGKPMVSCRKLCWLASVFTNAVLQGFTLLTAFCDPVAAILNHPCCLGMCSWSGWKKRNHERYGRG